MSKKIVAKKFLGIFERQNNFQIQESQWIQSRKNAIDLHTLENS